MNIGTRPTINGDDQTIEVHLFDFNEDIYDKKIKVEVHEFIRDERKFESFEALKIQIQEDKEIGIDYFKNSSF
jgi:riboflavin kinase/FMN adenylyltransferase